MFTVLCKVSKHTEPAEYELQKGAGPPFLSLHCPKKKERISPCHSYSSKRKLLLFVKEALKSSDMKGKSSLREEGHGVRDEIKGAIFPPRRESSAGASRNLGEGLLRGRGKGGAILGARGDSAVREGSGCKEVKSLASVPKTSHPLGHPARNTRVGEAAPPELRLRQAVGHRGLWDAEGHGCGEPCSPLGLGEGGCAPSPRPAAAVCLWGVELSDGRGQGYTSDHLQPSLPSSPSIHAGCSFCCIMVPDKGKTA